MKSFRFSLESVLQLRKEQEDAAERALSGARQTLAAAEKLCDTARGALRDCWTHSRDIMQGGAPVIQFEQARRYAASLQERMKALEVKRKQAAEAVDKALARLRTARQKREMLGKLRERRLQAYRASENAWEQREADERSTAAYARDCAWRLTEVA